MSSRGKKFHCSLCPVKSFKPTKRSRVCIISRNTLLEEKELHILEMENEMTPLKLGIRTQPPSLTLVYENETGKKRQRIMPIKFLNKYGSVETVIKELKERHKDHLKKVLDVRIEKMLRILQEVQKGRTADEAITMICREYDIDPEQDLNKLSDEQLTKKKKIMNSSFEKNQLKPGDPGFEYDKQVDYTKNTNVEAGWDSAEEEEDFWS